MAGFIVGFDNDTLATFEHQYRFIVASGVQAAMVGLLIALPKTPLYKRLEQEGRLRPAASGTDNTKPATNVVPKRMPYEAMIETYEAMYRRLVSDRNIAERIRNKLRFMRAPVYQGEYSFREQLGILRRLIVKGIFPGGISRVWHFLRTLPLGAPRKLPLFIVDWIAGLSMRNYVDRYFGKKPVREGKVAKLFEAIQRISRTYQLEANISLSLRMLAVPNLSVCLRGGLYQDFFSAAARHLEKLLRKTQSTITLRIEALREQERPHLDRLLARLARHGDRIFIVVDERLRKIIRIDSSIFQLVLEGNTASLA